MDTPWTEIRDASQRPEGVANVVGGGYPLRKPVSPVRYDVRHDGNSSGRNVLQRDLIARHEEEVGRRALSRIRPVEVGRGSHDNDAREVNEAAACTAEKRSERAVILLLRRAVCRRFVREEPCRVLKGFREQSSRPEGVRRRGVAGDHARRLNRRRELWTAPVMRA
ncbi:hypothetical protein NUW54_g13551 [Trametes sanguinea]|uniref:Uncharacterized protein n=1 Tax=Trametes sanguinea TaxID=158606 RepID=A0ACC1MJS9_9APHY|nr:hypothetical protein NUW54_g13551 [Trametes sanguinea]